MQILPRSLQKRFIYLSVLLGILIIGSSALVYLNIIKSRDAVSEEIRQIDKRLEIINRLRAQLVQLQFDIDSYLLDPTQAFLQKRIFNALVDLRVGAGLLQDQVATQSIKDKVDELQTDLNEINDAARELIHIRLDVNRQYPGMALSAFQMSAVQDEVQKNFSILLGEIESGVFTPQSTELYPLLLKSRTIWTALVSQMRIYLANRLASFSSEVLLAQAQSAYDISDSLKANFEQLDELYQSEPESFEGAGAIAALRENLSLWLVRFDEMRAKSESPQWRQDWSMMESVIIPLQKRLSLELVELESLLRNAERFANEQLESNTNGMFLLTASVMLAGVIYIVMMILSMNLMIFKPIRSVSAALRARAFEQEVPAFSARQSEETQLLIEAFEEMDLQVSQRQDALEHQSFHDVLTSLPNRIRLNDRLKYFISRSGQEKSQFVLMVIGISHFNDLIDSIGHQLTDRLVLEFAGRLQEAVPETDTVARVSPDEFALVLNSMVCKSCEAFTRCLVEQLAEPYQLDEHKISLSVNVGLASFPDSAEEGQLLLQCATTAMNAARRTKQPFVFYDRENDEHNINRLAITRDLRKALDNDEMEMYFQPQLSLKNNRVTGAEALLRWKHPVHGFIRPDRIIDMADQGGMINDLCMWVIGQTLSNCKRWHQAGYPLTVSINLSVQNLEYGSLCESIQKNLDRWQVSPEHVMFEITESSMMHNPGRSIEVLNRLHRMGLKLSIDDFGTGFSSLSYLQKLPVDEVKIDRSFVMNMDASNGDRVIVESVIDLGHNLGLSVVAEGIETNRVLRALAKMQCDYAQGFLISKPKPGDEFLRWLGKNSVINHDLFLEKSSG